MIDLINGCRLLRNHAGQAAGRDNLHILAIFGLEPAHNLIDLSHAAEDDTRLHARHCITADNGTRRHQTNTRQLGCTLETPRDMYLGFYYAPGVVCEAIKTAIYAQCLLELVGKKPIPRYCEAHNDIVTCFDAGTADALIGFCRGVQAASPVDSYAAPEPSPEPGYTDEVVMASGSFTQGSTIELSCDGPLRAPYTCYLQGGLNFAASRAGVLLAVQKAYFKE